MKRWGCRRLCWTCRKTVWRKCWDSARFWTRRWTPWSRDCRNCRRASRKAKNSSRRTHHRISNPRRPDDRQLCVSKFHYYIQVPAVLSNTITSCRLYILCVFATVTWHLYHSVSSVRVVDDLCLFPLTFISEQVHEFLGSQGAGERQGVYISCKSGILLMLLENLIVS